MKRRRRNHLGDKIRLIASIAAVLMALCVMVWGATEYGSKYNDLLKKAESSAVVRGKENALPAYLNQADETVINEIKQPMTIVELYALIEKGENLKFNDFEPFDGEDSMDAQTKVYHIENGWSVHVGYSEAGNRIEYARLYLPEIAKYDDLLSSKTHKFIYDHSDKIELNSIIQSYIDTLMDGQKMAGDGFMGEHCDEYATIIRMRPVGLRYLVPMLETGQRTTYEELVARMVEEIIMTEVGIPLPESYDGLLQRAVSAYETWRTGGDSVFLR